ncbi:membrane anchor subunit of succinate dehydrogenase, Sdh4 [Cladochytrium tenue]|nr:membrane anchor subunit of succinate dehydrogenase, Sdh4 [Cladochytrium tenue]
MATTMLRAVRATTTTAAAATVAAPAGLVSATRATMVMRLHAGAAARFDKTPAARSSAGEGAVVMPPVTHQHKSKAEGSQHWSAERVLSAVSVPLLGAAYFVGPGPFALDLALGVVLPLHVHYGFDVCITDYIPERKFGALHYVARGALYVSTALTLYACYRFNTKDVGITQFVADLWHGPKKPAADRK